MVTPAPADRGNAMTRPSYLTDPDLVVGCFEQATKAITADFFAAQGPAEPGARQNRGKGDCIPIGAANIDALEGVASHIHGSLEKLPRCSTSNAVVLITEEGHPIVFARPGSDSYRAYVHAMAKRDYNIDPANSSLWGYDIDHVASRASSAWTKVNYVAVVAVEGLTNKSYASIERALCDPPDILGFVKPNLY